MNASYASWHARCIWGSVGLDHLTGVPNSLERFLPLGRLSECQLPKLNAKGSNPFTRFPLEVGYEVCKVLGVARRSGLVGAGPVGVRRSFFIRVVFGRAGRQGSG